MPGPGTADARQRRYGELLQQIGGALLAAAPPEWRRLDLIAKIAEGAQELGLTVIRSDFSDGQFAPPEQLTATFAELRRLMDDEQRGSWRSARYTIDPPSAFQVFYNYDHDPQWDPPLPAEVLERDLQAHPPQRDPTLLEGTGRIGIEQQRLLQRAIADLLVARAPADRDQVRVMYNAVGRHEEMIGHVLGIDGQLREWEPPRELAPYYQRLRAGMYTEGVGTWTAASTVVEYPIRLSIDYRNEARWHRAPTRRDVLDELELYPRTADRVPDWMSRLLVPPLSDRDHRVLAIIERRVSEAGAIPETYRILGSAEGATCLERVGEEWQVAFYERGKPRGPKRFAQLWDAGAFLLGSLTIIRSSLRGGGGDRNTATALNDWPIQPLPGEPPLTLLADKHVAVLMPGRELVRYGTSGGNLAFAAGTEFSAMSLRPERAHDGPRRFRVRRELRVLAGEVVPWHDQPGGGVAYFLPTSVADHVADGSLAEVTDEPGPGLVR